MLAVKTSLHLGLKVASPGAELNDLAVQARHLGAALSRVVIARCLWTMQERALRRVWVGTRELACPGCGVVHRGSGSLLRRGRRARTVQTSSGPVHFALRQVSCGLCRKTFCPFGSALGLRPRQRVAEELLERLDSGVVDLSYRKTCTLGAEWLGSTVSPGTLWRDVQVRGRRIAFTRRRPLKVLLVDGTRVRAGTRLRGEAAVIGLQIEGREQRGCRIGVRKRLIGLGVGLGAWETVLAAGSKTPLVVTDAASGVREKVSAACPHARHQLCEWHLTHSLKHFLTLHGVRPARRRTLARELALILGRRSWRAYATFQEKLRQYQNVASLLEQARPYIMYPEPSAERTTSLAEREMREINRRTDIGVRWSVSGVRNLLRLKLAGRHNPDDYARLWQPKRLIHWQLVPQPA